MVRIFRLEEIRELGGPKRNPRGDDGLDARAEILAEKIVRRLQNDIGVVSAEEAVALAKAEAGSADEFYCTECGFRLDPEEASCPKCGSRTASRTSSYKCTKCAADVDPTDARCSRCGGTKATSSAAAEYECQRCGHPVDIGAPTCGNCGHDKAVAR